MTNRKRVYSVFICFTLVFYGCSQSYKQLSDAEALMTASPDQSLSILYSLNGPELHSERQRALFALLMSEALHKNYIDVTSDSLINVAVNFYSRTKNHRRRMQANYYKGIVLRNAQDYAYAAVSMEKARKEAEFLGDYFYLGQVFRALAAIMNETNNNPEAINYEKKAILNYHLAGAETYEHYAKAALATGLVNNRLYAEAEILIDSLIVLQQNQSFLDHCNLLKAQIILETDRDDISDAISIYQTADKDLFFITDYAYYAYALDKIGHESMADHYIEEAYLHSKDYADSATVDAFHARIENKRRNFSHAYSLIENASEVQDSLTRLLLQQSISIAQRDFFKEEARNQELQTHNAKQTSLFIVILSVLTVCIIILLSSIRIKKINAIKKEQMVHLVFAKQREKNLLMDNASILGALLSERLGHLDKLADEYFLAETPEDRAKVFKEYKKRQQSIQNDSTLYSSIEADLNRYCDGIMDKLGVEVPSIKGNNRKIISLFFAGLPNITVQLITGKISLSSIEMTRSRFRKMIKESDSTHKALFLDLLETKKRQTGENNVNK